MKPVILLDLNYTLVANSHIRRSPFLEQIKQERYRINLIDLVRPFEVILISARPEKYKAVTLANIEGQTNWLPAAAYFNDTYLPPHLFKRKTFIDKIERKYSPERFLAIESNPKTIKEYQLFGVTCLSVIPEVPHKKNNAREKE